MSFRPLMFAVPATTVFSLVAAAGLAWTSPAAALDSGSDDPLEMAQATPPAAPPPAAGGQERRERAAFNPKAFCLDRVAHRAGARAYLKVRLELTADQMTAWNAFSKAADDADAKETTRCNALPTDMKERPNFVDRLSREEDFMKARIERIEAVKPTLTAFYNTLTPEQKAVLDRPRPMGGMMAREGHHPGGPR
ncbi:MAG: Spy/CpxP family protein refolding chaperone [Hyphomicrobium sp.]